LDSQHRSTLGDADLIRPGLNQPRPGRHLSGPGSSKSIAYAIVAAARPWAARETLIKSAFPSVPFFFDAGTDNEGFHQRSSDPSWSKVSEGGFLDAVSLRNSAARSSKEGSTSASSAWRRISRCSASTERPCRAARSFSFAIGSSSRLRTCRLPAITVLSNESKSSNCRPMRQA